VTNAAADHLCFVEALFVTADTGDIELWAASEVTAEMTLSAGSSGMLVRTA